MSCTQACNQGRNCTCAHSYKAVLQQALWEADQNRPYDWQDKFVIGASVFGIFAALAIITWWR